MSNRRGRCFRQQRRTKQRKARQVEAFAALKRVAPHVAQGFSGLLRHDLTINDLNPHQKQQLVQGYKKFMSAPVRLRRAARGT